MTKPTIIAATDLTARSDNVAGRARRIADTLGADLVVAHVPPDDGAAKPVKFGVLARAKGHPVDRTEALQACATEVNAEAVMLDGPADVALNALARERSAVLIVLGLHNERRVLDLLRLTTMERIVRDSQCPVLIAHWPPDQPYRQVLAAVDFSEASADALRAAARIAPRAHYYAIHALPVPMGSLLKPKSAEMEATLDATMAKALDFVRQPGMPPLTELPEVVPGGVHQVLEYRRSELNADLVAIGAQSSYTPDSLGSYARDLMRAPHTDLLVAPAPRPPSADEHGAKA